MTVLMSVLSQEYLLVPVSSTRDGKPYDPTTDAVSFAFKPRGDNPTGADWKPGVWETLPSGAYVAKCLIGPTGTAVLPVGTYTVWLRIADPSETPVRVVDTLVIQ